MSYNRIELNDNWQLGWYPDPVLGKWCTRYNGWHIEDGKLKGEGFQALIFPTAATENDYRFECDFTLPSENERCVFCMKFSEQRLAYYGIYFHAGEKSRIYYVFSEMFDHEILKDIDINIEVGKKYRFSYSVTGTSVSVSLDGQTIAEFEADCPSGRNSALFVNAGCVEFENVLLTDTEDDKVIFSDDFSENTLAVRADADLSELDNINNWIPAKVPGSVHKSLLEAGIIEDPYKDYNGPKQLWTDRQRWFYKKTFTVPEAFRGKNLRLEFYGVDYHGYFWLNGTKLCYHEGMFGGPDANVTKLINFDGENELVVCILPCPTPPHNNVRPYILHRWHFNMDIIPCGIWRGVHLTAEDNVTLFDPQITTLAIKNGIATVEASVSIGNTALWPFDARGSFTLRSPCSEDEAIVAAFAPGFFQGCQRVTCRMEVPNARLWWPNGMGKQELYDVDITIDLYEHQKSQQPTGHDELHFKTGLRTFRLEPAPDKGMPEWDSGNLPKQTGLYNWCMTVNGRPFFGKGSNWMPIDQMLDLPRERYELLLGRARDCNINILRPWGAGLIETDEFYETCDKYGIMVWQELLMANGMYNRSDINVWRDTLRRSVRRIRNHPSLAVWCGGNEFDPDCEANRTVVDEMAEICNSLDPSREFHRACPYGGDSHSYQVNWMEGAYYTYYTHDKSIAVTEFSMASPPNMDTLKKLIPAEELEKWPPDLPDKIDRYDYTEWGENVRRRESGFSMHDAHLSSITNVMLPPMSDCGIPKSWDELIKYMQTAHGLLTQFGIDCWRSSWPECTMEMSWVFNVIFPDTMSWSYIDYYGIPKRSYYYKKRASEALHITAVFDDLFTPAGERFRAKLDVINETDTAYGGAEVRVRLYNTSFELLSEYTAPLSVRPHDITGAGFFVYNIPNDADDGVMLLCADLLSSDGVLLSRSQYCPRIGTPSKRMPYLNKGPWISEVENHPTHLSVSASEKTIDTAGEAFELTITNDGGLPAFQVGISCPGNEEFMTYSDNYFWMESGEAKTVRVSSKTELGTITVDAWNAEPITVG